MDIQNVFLLMAAIVERAQSDANISKRHTTSDFPRTCTVTAKDHPARDCAIAFLQSLHPSNKDAVELCFEVTELWQQ